MTSILRDVSYKVTGLKAQLQDSKAIKENLPHVDLNKLLPFNNDEDMVTVLDSAGLSNALYSKVSTNLYRSITST